MLVQSYLIFPTGSRVKVRLELGTGLASLHVGARVVRTIETDCMGLQFESLDAGERKRVQEFLLPLILAAT